MGIDAGSDREGADLLIQKIRDLQKEIGEPLSLKEAGVTEMQMKENMDTLVHLGSKDPNMFTTPCECRGEKLSRLFWEMWKGV